MPHFVVQLKTTNAEGIGASYLFDFPDLTEVGKHDLHKRKVKITLMQKGWTPL